jgi:cobalt-zinc-cadmium efflux system protein
VAASVGVVVGALIILATRLYLADPLISVLIALLIARSAWRILRETTDILLEGSPKGLDTAQLVRDIVREPGITDVHDLHVWSIDGNRRALSAHIEVTTVDLRVCESTAEAVKKVLKERYAITHSTLQFECTSCDPNLYCSMEAQGGVHGHGGHPHEGGVDGLHAGSEPRRRS